MALVEYLPQLYDYNYWANARILEAAANLNNEQFIAPGILSHGGLRDTLVHSLTAEWIWRMRCQERVSPPAMLNPEDFPTLVDLRTRWQAEEEALRAYVTGLTEEDLNETIHYISTEGISLSFKLWQILVHLVNHGTQTRSEAAILLTEYGHSPGDLDLLIYFHSHG